MRVAISLGVVLLALAGCSSAEQEGIAPQPEVAPTATEPGVGTEPPAEEGPLRLERVASGLDAPFYLTFAPGQPGRFYVVQQAGRVVVLEAGEVQPRPFLDIAGEVQAGGEQGLLGLAFHPEYESNRLLYVHFTNLDGDTRVVEYRASAGGQEVDPTSARELLAVEQPYANHNGGQIAFGPDGRLWVGLGDGGSAGDPENRAQNLSDPLGKLLAADVDAAEPRFETVAYGLRNPWRFSFDRENGDLWIGDVGQNTFEEINRLPAEQVGDLVNFGWDVFEGREVFEDKEPSPEGELVDPVAVYEHSEGCSVIGGYVYRGSAVPEAAGRYFFGDYCSGRVWSLDARSPGAPREEPFQVELLASFGEDDDGELYLVSLRGAIFRLADG